MFSKFAALLSFLLICVSTILGQTPDSAIVPNVHDSLSIRADTALHKGDSIYQIVQEDADLRIRNLNPYITLHVDSVFEYSLEINKPKEDYYWFLINAPIGLKVNRETGTLQMKGEKGMFLSGRLKYDVDYKVRLGVQNLDNPKDRLDTSFTLVFFNTEIIPSRLKPSVNNVVYVDEGDSISFKIQCEDGNFPIEQIIMTSNYPIKTKGPVTRCGDEFFWAPPFGFVRSTDTSKQRTVLINFVGANKFNVRDTAVIRIIVKENINYPQKVREFQNVVQSVNLYSNRLKATFMELDKEVKTTKSARTTFELTSAATALGGTVFSSLPGEGQKTAGKILPSAGVAMVPVKETVAPNKSSEQNSATLVRNSIKRLEYVLQNNRLVGDRDPDLLAKMKKIQDELLQIQTQLIEIPVIEVGDNPEELDKYFNNPKVNKKYRMRRS